MNPRLRLLTFFFLLIAVSGPLGAQGHLLEFQAEAPKINVIIDDPDPTHGMRLRLRYVAVGVEHVLLFGSPADPSSAGFVPLVAWSRRSASGHDVVISRFENEVFGRPLVVADSSADERDPRLAQDPRDGTVHLVYWIDGDTPVVVHRTAPADLSAWSEPERVSAPGERAARPSGAIHDGTVRVAYESLSPAGVAGPSLIVLATQAGSAFTREPVASTSSVLPAWPRLHGAGARTWIDWIDDAGTLAWRALSADAAFEPIGTEPIDTPYDRELARGRLALGAGGNPE